jgi:hypothetical protein
VREFAGHSDIRTTEVDLVRKEEDAEMAARRIPDPADRPPGPVSPLNSSQIPQIRAQTGDRQDFFSVRSTL